MLEVKDRLSKLPEKEEREELEKDLRDLNNLDTEEADEEEMLNFCNLKKIDRKSVQLPKSRISTVSFKEDTEITYDADETETKENKPRRSLKDQYTVETLKEIIESQKQDMI